MSEQTLNVRISLRNDTAANWSSKNPILSKGEMGVEINTGRFKFGDGVTAWSDIKKYGGVVVAGSSNNGNILIDGAETIVYTLPVADATNLGGVKSSTGVNNVTINSAGFMSVNYVSTADKLSTARTISVSGDASGSTTFDGTNASDIKLNLTNTGVTSGSYTKTTVDAKGRVIAGAQLDAADIPTIDVTKVTGLGTAATHAIGTDAGEIPVLGVNGKLADAVIPALAISEISEVANEASMLALKAERGDVAVRSDTNNTYILKTDDPTKLENWVLLKTPTDAVSSVNGKQGVIVLTTADIAEGTNLYWTQARFDTAFVAKKSTMLSDSSSLLRNTDTLILDCGNA